MKRLVRITLVAMGAIAGAVVLWAGGRTAYYFLGPSEHSLAATGYECAIAARAEEENTYAFVPRYPFWSDGATKRRFIHLPPGTRIDTSDPDRWNFPEGTRLWKEFERNSTVVEVRMLFKHGAEPWQWDMAVYSWGQDRKQARKLAFARENVLDTPHDIPAPSQCVTCHGAGKSRRPLGVTAMQLPWTDAEGLSLSELIERDLVTEPPPGPYVIPGNELERNALGYLDSNCGTCHNDQSTFVDQDVPLRLNLKTEALSTVDSTNAYRTVINVAALLPGLDTTVYVRPGSLTESYLLRRMAIRDGGGWQMPPIATERVDQRGVELIEAWIRALEEEGPAP